MENQGEGTSSSGKVWTLVQKHWAERFPEWYSIFLTTFISCIGAICCILIVQTLEDDFYYVTPPTYEYTLNFYSERQDSEGNGPMPFHNFIKITGMTDKTDCATAPSFASSYCSTLQAVGFKFLNDADIDLDGRSRENPLPRYFQIDEGNEVRWATILLRQRPAYNIFLEGAGETQSNLDVHQEFAFILDIIDTPGSYTTYDELISNRRIVITNIDYDQKEYDRLIMSWWIGYVFGFLVGFFLTWDVVSVVWYIGKERQSGTKDLMSFLGLDQTQYWISHFIAYVGQQFVPFLVTFIILTSAYQTLDDKFNFDFDAGTYIYLFWILLTAHINIGLFGFASSSFTTTDNIHDAWSWTTSLVLQFIPPLIMLFDFNREGPGPRFVFQFIPLLNFYFGLRDSILGIQADTVFFSIFNFFFWGVLTFYFDLVIPTAKGSQMRPCCFCCKSRPNSQVSVELGEEEEAIDPTLTANNVLVIKNLVRKFDKLTAVDGVDLVLEGDQIFGLLGFNGAGKTTTISMITGILPPTSGKIFIHGQDITTNLEALRRRMSYCPQVNILWDNLTVMEHLKLFGRLRGIADDLIKEQSAQFLEELEMTHTMNNRSKNLSGGEKRKLMIIQAFIGDPGFILLDEPTAGVDPDSAKQILDLIIRYKTGKLIILTTHHMEEADMLSDEIAIMAAGKIMVRGTPTELKVQYGRGTGLEITPNTVDLNALQNNFDIQLEETSEVLRITIHQEKDILGVLQSLTDDKIKIKNNSLESVFLNLAQKRAENRSYNEDFEVTLNQDSVKKIQYERPGCCRKSWLLLKNRACIQYRNLGPFLLAIALLLIVAIISFVGQVSFGFKNTPSNWPSLSQVGKFNVYGTGTLFESTLSKYGVTKSGSIPLKQFVQDTPKKVAIEHVSDARINVRLDPFYASDGSTVVSALFLDTRANVLMNDEIALGNLIASYFNTFYFIIGSGAVVACIYKYTRLEIEERRLEMQLLMGVPYWLFWLINFLCDFLCVVLAAVIFMVIVSFDSPEDIRDGIASMSVAATGFLFFAYSIGKLFSLQRLIVAFFGINFFVAVVITIINFQDVNWIRKIFGSTPIDWSTGFSKTTIILVGIALYSMPAGQFFMSQMLFLYTTWIPGVRISQNARSLHWLFCWLGNGLWVLVFVLTEITWRSDPRVPEIEPLLDEGEPLKDAQGLVAHNLSKVYKDTVGMDLVACKKVSFKVQEGRCFGLLGKNGAGKSTMMNMLSTLVRPTSGKGFVKGLDIEVDVASIRNIIGKCDQDSIYWDYYTARDHLRYFGLLKGVPEDSIDALIEYYAVSLKFAEYLDTLCGQLSGGNKRKVSLCTAVIGSCDVLVLDEPSAGVDPFARDEMRKVIGDMKKGRICLFTSHVMEEAEIMCDDVLVMVRGEVKVSGTLNELVEQISEGYYLRIEKTELSPDDIQNVIEGLQQRLNVQKTADDKKEIIFLVPFFVPLHEVFEVAIETKDRFGCNFLVESASLSQLFMRIVDPEFQTEIEVEPDNGPEVEMQNMA